MIEGSIAALVTPFAGKDLDESAFAELVAGQIENGTRGLVPCSATGEGPTLTPDERGRLIRICVEVAGGHAAVIAATGTNCTEGTIALADQAKGAGAGAVLIVMPYYNRPAQEGLYRHVEAVARAVDMPLILHECPDRTGVHLQEGTIERLARLSAVIGFCGASKALTHVLGPPDRARHGLVRLGDRDDEAVAFNLAGGHGCLSVLANVLPALCASLQAACLAEDYDRAGGLQARVLPLIAALERDSDPVGIKQAVAMMRPGFAATLRLPLVEPTAEVRRTIAVALRDVVAADEGAAGPRAARR